MKRLLSLCFLALVGVFTSALADGLIVVHEPMPWLPPGPPPHRIFPPAPRSYPFAPLEVRFHQVDVQIEDQVAVTKVDQEFYNPNDRQLEGTYLFPIPTGAQIDKFSMDIGGQQVEAELISADKARQIYEDIVRKMKDPALLEYAGRDVFKVRVYPIEPHSAKRIKLAYTQVLKSDAGLVGYLYPLNTEKFSAKPIKTVSLKIQVETRQPLKSIYSPSHAVEIRRSGLNQATIGFEAADARPDTDFQLYFSQEAKDLGLNLMTHHSEAEDGYFLLLAAPGLETKRDQVLPKDVVFVLDTSGSMAGKKLAQAKKALQFCVENLNDSDRFEILRFSTDIEPLFAKLADATKENRTRAVEFVEKLKPTGGTALDEAMRWSFSPMACPPWAIPTKTRSSPA
jgi:Ca-activated chloride channel family protein